jgi:hypothetical protein
MSVKQPVRYLRRLPPSPAVMASDPGTVRKTFPGGLSREWSPGRNPHLVEALGSRRLLVTPPTPPTKPSRLSDRACRTLREPSVNRSQQFARLLHIALVAPEAGKAHGGAQFPRFGLLLACDGKCFFEVLFDLRYINFRAKAALFPRYAIDLWLMQDLAAFFPFLRRLRKSFAMPRHNDRVWRGPR